MEIELISMYIDMSNYTLFHILSTRDMHTRSNMCTYFWVFIRSIYNVRLMLHICKHRKTYMKLGKMRVCRILITGLCNFLFEQRNICVVFHYNLQACKMPINVERKTIFTHIICMHRLILFRTPRC